jgi:peptidoglycan/LPS O-acetylase OafA/YrhL
MTARRLRVWAMVAILLAVGLWILQALVGLNFSDEGEEYPWYLRAVQWLALGLVLLSLPMLVLALTRSRAREDS